MIRFARLRGFSRSPISEKNSRYRLSLARTVKGLAAELGSDCEVVLLGSVARGKYLNILGQILGDQLLVPAEFIGRGDLSRGALLLRCIKDNRELNYVPILRVADWRLMSTLRADAPNLSAAVVGHE